MNTENNETNTSTPPLPPSAGSAAHVEKLLDAAFRELQHDTGPSNEEYVWQRKNLKAEFNRILRVRKNDKGQR